MARVRSVEDLRQLLLIANYPELGRFQPAEVFAALESRRNRGVRSPADIMVEEWQAFCHPGHGAGRTQFETESVEVPEELHGLIERVVLARRLREVRAIIGFSRIDTLGEPGEDMGAAVRIAPLSAAQSSWLPAVETLGEGIFLQFNEQALSAWERRRPVTARNDSFAAVHAAWRQEKGLPPAQFPGSRYVLIHSLAHALIRQFSLECGYTASSLRERIYCSTTEPRMAGVLIYTAAADSEGSLGGLVELGLPRTFGPLILNALRGNSVCSSDPLCAGHGPGTHGALNGSACHACIMASETSCERGNRLLDRNLLVPTFSQLGSEFFPPELCR